MHRLLFLVLILSFLTWIDATTECFGLSYTDLNVCGGKGRCVATDICVCDHSHIGEECNEFIGAIEASNFQSYVIQKSHKKFSFGAATDGRLGHGPGVTTNQNLPKEIEANEPISTVQISSFLGFALAWDSANNRAYSFGANNNGQLGHDDTDLRNIPTLIDESSGISCVAAGASHSLYISSGLVYSFGTGSSGRLGHGNNDNQELPLLIETSDFDEMTHISVAAGEMHSLSLTSEFKVYSWGNGWYGNLGHGDQVHHDTPQLIQDLENLVVIQIGAGVHFSIVLTNEFKIFTFGYGANGRLGHGDDDDEWSPTELVAANGLNIRKFAVGPSHNLLLAEDGKVYAFGLGDSGQLGLGDLDPRYTPTLIPDIEPMAQISAGNQHSLIAKEDGTVYSFGNNNHGRTGLGTTNGLTQTPTLCMCPENRFGSECNVACDGVLANEDFVCGGHGSCDDTDDCTCSADYDETDECDKFACFDKDSQEPDVCNGNGACGDNDQCFCGEYYDGEQCDTFQGSVQGGYLFSFIVRKSKNVLGFGYSDYGYLGLGDETTDSQLVPVTLTLSNITQISSCYYHSLALNTEGKVFTMGWSDPPHAFGLDGNDDTIFDPTQITQLDDEFIVQVAAGSDFSLVVSEEGKLFSFGADTGALGRLANDLGIPTEVEGLDGVFVTKVSAGNSHSLVLSSKGRVYSFGLGTHGRLGHGDLQQQAAAKRIDRIAGIRAVSAGGSHSLLLGTNGRVYAFGNYNDGRLGLGEDLDNHVLEPTLISAIDSVNIVRISAGDSYSFVLSDAGRVYAFGIDNGDGMMGLGNIEDEIFEPMEITNLQNIREIAASQEQSLFADHHGNVYACGMNDGGSTGLGLDSGQTFTPELVICGEDRFGDDCEVKCFDLLSSNQTVCNGQGNCTATDQCECESGFSGNECEDWACSGIVYNDANACNGHGNCVGPNDCQCNTNYNGDACEQWSCYETDNDNENVCSGHGDCVAHNDCDCEANYDGDQCEQWSCHGTENDDEEVCSGRGECVAHNDCECPAGYSGECDEWSCFSVAKEVSAACSGHGECVRPDRCSCANTNHGLKCGQALAESFDDDSYRDNLETINDAADIADATKFFFNNHRVCRSNACQSENEYVEFALKRLRDKILGGDEGLTITETIDFVNDLSNSSFSLTDGARSAVIAILEKETCERLQTTSVKNHMSKIFNAVHDLKFGALKGMKLLRCLATTLRRNDNGELVDVTATRGPKMRLTSEKNIEMSVFSVRANSFDKDLLIIESEDDDFGSVLEISGIDEDGTILETEDLEDLVSFQIQTNESQWISNYSCLYYDEDDSEWQFDGLSLNENANGNLNNVTCHTSHFTLFRVEVNYEDQPLDDEVDTKSTAKFQWWMGLLIALAVVVIVAILIAAVVVGLKIILTLKKSKKSQRSTDIEMRKVNVAK